MHRTSRQAPSLWRLLVLSDAVHFRCGSRSGRSLNLPRPRGRRLILTFSVLGAPARQLGFWYRSFGRYSPALHIFRDRYRITQKCFLFRRPNTGDIFAVSDIVGNGSLLLGFWAKIPRPQIRSEWGCAYLDTTTE
jgi:hypothetical protein